MGRKVKLHFRGKIDTILTHRPMTFLNPLVLFGLAAAALPVVLHLLHRRRLRTIEFSTLRFLKEIRQSALRAVNLRQWLLLVIRTLLIVALVLMFSRPVLRGGPGGGLAGGGSSAAVVILLDDSPSMNIRNERGLLFDQAREAASRIIGLASPGDRIAVIPLSAILTDTTLPGFRSPAGARIFLGEREPTQVRGSMIRGIDAGTRLLDSAYEANRELYLVTDGQGTQFAPEKGDSLIAPSGPQHLFVVRVPPAGKGNAGVSSARCITRIRSAGRTVQLAVAVRNFGQSPLSSLPVHVYLDGIRVAQQVVAIPPGATVQLSFPLLPRRSGILRGWVQIEDEGLDLDDVRPFILSVPAESKVLVAGSDTRFISLALTLGGDSLVSGRVRLRQITGAQLPSAPIAGSDVLLLSGIDHLSPSQGSAISSFVKRGGAAIIFPGREMDPLSYRMYLWDPLGLPGWRPVGGVPVAGEGVRHTIASFARFDVEHPILAGLLAEGKNARGEEGIGSPEIFRTAGLRGDPRGNGIITLTNGELFLAEYRSGAGTLLVFGVEAGTEWSDLPLRGIFAPLLHRCVAYLTSLPEEDPVTTGAPIRFPLRRVPEENGSRLLLRLPDGSAERIAPVPARSGDGSEAVSSPALEAGIYSLLAVRSGDTTLLAARGAVIPEEEGDLRSLSDDELLRAAGGDLRPQGSAVCVWAEGIETTMRERRVGRELWAGFLLLAVSLAIAEMVIGRERKEEDHS
jgi:hypothetical protein